MRRYLIASLVLVVAVITVPPPAAAGEHTVTLQQGQEVYGQTYTGTGDSQIYDWTADTNYGRRPEAKTGGNDKKRLLIQFKIFASEGGPVPDGATVTSAALKLYKLNGNDYGPYNVYQVLKAWKEVEVTYNSAATGDAWNTPGCEGAGTDRTTDPVATPSVSSGWMDVDVTSSVQGYAGGTDNNGWLLVDSYGNYRTWATRDYTTDTSLRPKLEITYTGNTDPVAKAYALPQKGIAPFAVTFDASASEDADGTIVSFSWSFGDGSDPVEGERVEHTYSTANTYTATLTITDDEGGVDTLNFEITAYDLNEVYTVTYQEGQDVGGNPYDGTRDASMYSPHPDSNYDSSSETFRSASSFRPIISFEVFESEGGVVPAGSEIVSATLYLYKTSNYSIFPEMHQLKKTFVEGEVTWNNASTAEAWESGGASGSSDRVTEAVANPWMGWDPGWLLSDVTGSVQSMSDGAANDGWVFTDSYSNIRHFASRENTDTTIRPKLVITYRRKPTAVIATTPNPPKGLTPCTIQFDGSGSTDPDGTILFHYWNFGDGEIGEGETVSHTYIQAGCFKATLTITDDQGATASASVFVGVAEEGSGTENITLQDGLNGYAGTEDTYLEEWAPDATRGDRVDLRYRKDKYNPLVKFKIFTTEGGPVNAARRVKDAKLSLYKHTAYDSTMGAKRLLKAWTEAAATWNKFDGTTAWATPGAKGVGTDVATGEEPLVSMGWDPTWVEFPVTEDVEGFRQGAAANNGWHIWRYWGNTNTKKFHSSEYATDTTLRPKLVLQISDNAAPVASAEADVVLGSPPLAVQFTGTGIDVDGSIAGWSWNFGDSSDPSDEQNPVHAYQATGRYTATLTVTDNDGLTAQASVAIEVEEPYDLTFQEGDGGDYSDTEDCNLKEAFPTINEHKSSYLNTNSASGNVRRALIRFPDLIGSNVGQIPHDAKIVSAKLRLTKTSTLADQQIAVFRITEDWSIPYSSPDWDERRAGGALWGGIGCSFVDENNQSHLENAEDIQVMDGRPFPYEWDVTAAVQAWANDADQNHGLVVEALSGAISFRSSDHDSQSLRPILLVTLSDLSDNQNPKLVITTQQPTSQTKKAFIEGTKDPEVDTIVLTAGGYLADVTVVNPTKWFAFVERVENDNVELVATATDSTGNQTQVVDTLTYTPIDAASTSGLVMQVEDSALVTVTTSHEDADSIEIDPGDGTTEITGSLESTFEVLYETAGDFVATVKVLDDQGAVLETYQVDITAISVTMREGFVLGVKQGTGGSGPEPYYEIEVAPASAAELIYLRSGNDDLLTVKDREVTATGVKAKVVAEVPAVSTVYAQIGAASEVIGSAQVAGFRMHTSNFFGRSDNYLGYVMLQMESRIDNLEFDVTLGMGATFKEGGATKTFVSDEFDADGMLFMEVVVPPTAPDMDVRVEAYQMPARQHIASLYRNTRQVYVGIITQTLPLGYPADKTLKGVRGCTPLGRPEQVPVHLLVPQAQNVGLVGYPRGQNLWDVLWPTKPPETGEAWGDVPEPIPVGLPTGIYDAEAITQFRDIYGYVVSEEKQRRLEFPGAVIVGDGPAQYLVIKDGFQVVWNIINGLPTPANWDHNPNPDGDVDKTAGLTWQNGVVSRHEPFDPQTPYVAVEVKGKAIGTVSVEADQSPKTVYVVGIEPVRVNSNEVMKLVQIEEDYVLNAIAHNANPPPPEPPLTPPAPLAPPPYWLELTSLKVGSNPTTRLSGNVVVQLTVDGKYFLEGATIQISNPGVAVGQTTWLSSEQLQAQVTVNNGGFSQGEVWVKNPDGHRSTNSVQLRIGARYDFGTSDSPVATGFERFQPVVKSGQNKIGYEIIGGQITAVDFGVGDDLLRDGHRSTREQTKVIVDAPAGSYRVEVLLGDPNDAVGPVDVSVNGTQIAESVTVDAGDTKTISGQVVSSGNQLEILLARTDGSLVTIRGLEIVPADGGVVCTVTHNNRHGMYLQEPSTATFTVNSQDCDMSGGQVRITLHDDLPAPQDDDPSAANYVTLTEGEGVDAEIQSVSGRVIVVDTTTMPPGKSFCLKYGDLGDLENPLPGVSASEAGKFPLKVESKLAGGSFKESGVTAVVEVVDDSLGHFPWPLPDDPEGEAIEPEPLLTVEPELSEFSPFRLAIRGPQQGLDLISDANVTALDGYGNRLMSTSTAIEFAAFTFPNNDPGLVATQPGLCFQGTLEPDVEQHFSSSYLLYGGEEQIGSLQVSLQGALGTTLAAGEEASQVSCRLLHQNDDDKKWVFVDYYPEDKVTHHRGSPKWSFRCVMYKDPQGEWQVRAGRDTEVVVGASHVSKKLFVPGNYMFRITVSNKIWSTPANDPIEVPVVLAEKDGFVGKDFKLSEILLKAVTVGGAPRKFIEGPGEVKLEVKFGKVEGADVTDMASWTTMIDFRDACYLIGEKDHTGKQLAGLIKNREADARETDELLYESAKMKNEYTYSLGTYRRTETWNFGGKNYNHKARWKDFRAKYLGLGPLGTQENRYVDWGDLAMTSGHGHIANAKLFGALLYLTSVEDFWHAWGQLDAEWAIFNSCLLFSNKAIKDYNAVEPMIDMFSPGKDVRERWAKNFAKGLHGICGFSSRVHPNVRSGHGFNPDDPNNKAVVARLRKQWTDFPRKARDELYGIGEGWNNTMALPAYWYNIYGEKKHVFFSVPAYLCIAGKYKSPETGELVEFQREPLPWGSGHKGLAPDVIVSGGDPKEKLVVRTNLFYVVKNTHFLEWDESAPAQEKAAVSNVEVYYTLLRTGGIAPGDAPVGFGAKEWEVLGQ